MYRIEFSSVGMKLWPERKLIGFEDVLNELTLLNEVIDVEDGISSDSLGLMDSSLSLRYLDFSLFFDRFVFDSKEAELSELSCLW